MAPSSRGGSAAPRRGPPRRRFGEGRPPSPPDAVSAPDVGGTGPVGWLGGFLFGQGAPPVCGTGYVSWLSGRILTWLRSALPDVGGTGSGSWLGESMGSNDTFVSPGRTPGPVGVKVKGPHTPPTPTPPRLSGGRQGWGGSIKKPSGVGAPLVGGRCRLRPFGGGPWVYVPVG